MVSKKDWLKGIGMGLMGATKQYNTNRKQQLEQLRADNLNKIASERNSLMGRQIDSMDTRNKADADWRTGETARLEGVERTRQAEVTAGIGREENRDTESQRRHEESMAAIEGQGSARADAYEAAKIREDRANEIADQLRTDAKTDQDRTRADNFVANRIGSTVGEFLNLKDIKESTAANSAYESIVAEMAMQPEKSFKELASNAYKNLGLSADDPTKVVYEKMGALLDSLEIKSKAAGVEISRDDLSTLVAPHIKPPEEAPAAPSAASSVDFASGRAPLSERSALFNPQTSSPDNAAEWLMQATTTPDDLKYGTGPLRRAVEGGDPEDQKLVSDALSMIEKDWATYSKRYRVPEGMSFKEYLPRLLEKLGMATPGDNPQSGLSDSLMALPGADITGNMWELPDDINPNSLMG